MQVEVQRDMYTTQPTNTDALLTSYLMQPSDVTVDSLHNDVRQYKAKGRGG